MNENKPLETMKLILISSIAFLFFAFNNSFAQTKATTEDGRKIILNEDGTWEFVEESFKDDNLSMENPESCNNWIETTKDKVTGDQQVTAKSKIIISSDGGQTGFGILAFLDNNNFPILSIQAVGAGNCIDESTKINILYRDGTRSEIYSNNDFNCDARASLYFGGVFGKSKELRNLSSKEIETMRVWTNDSYVEKDFTEEQSMQLKYTMKCLNN